MNTFDSNHSVITRRVRPFSAVTFLSFVLSLVHFSIQGEAKDKDPLARLRGKIIINQTGIFVPEDSEGFAQAMLEQHKPRIVQDFNSQYKFHYIAFFKFKPKVKKIFAVIESKEGDVLQIAEVPIKPTQETLESFLIVEGKPKIGQDYDIKVVKIKGKKKIVLARSEIVFEHKAPEK